MGSNSRLTDNESDALPTEPIRASFAVLVTIPSVNVNVYKNVDALEPTSTYYIYIKRDQRKI